MKPLDPRLVRYAGPTRGYLLTCVGLGVAGALLIVAQAGLLAEGITAVFQRGARLSDLRPTLLALAGVLAGRAVLAWAQEVAAHRTAAGVKTELRGRLLAHVVALGPGRLTTRRTGELSTLATRGIDALDGYFSRYLPQLVLAAIVPLVLLARILPADRLAGVTIVVTIPLIPIFMVLIGLSTQARNRRQFALLSRLAHHFLDVVAGLPTLKVFGRAKAQVAAIRTVTDSYRRATLGTLRVAFLSSLALEVLSTLSVALVAVGIGLRLVSGSMTLQVGLMVLILAPEVYLPLRNVGTHFHASAEGLAAAEEIFAVLETPLPAAGTRTDLPAPATLVAEGVTVRYPGRGEAALDGVSLSVRPGEVVAVTGPSGCGKSTLLSALLGFVTPDAGRVAMTGGGGTVPVTDADPDAWRSRFAWVPQRPHLFAGTIADNIRLGDPDADDDAVARAARAAGADGFVAALPDGYATVLGDDGAGLSAGQRQRLALARAFLRDAPILLLDEPTAALDTATETAVVEAIRRLAAGRTVVLVAHRPALLSLADRVVDLGAVPVAAGAVA
jgi:thiol reductant ABC exporter CydD subunit